MRELLKAIVLWVAYQRDLEHWAYYGDKIKSPKEWRKEAEFVLRYLQL